MYVSDREARTCPWTDCLGKWQLKLLPAGQPMSCNMLGILRRTAYDMLHWTDPTSCEEEYKLYQKARRQRPSNHHHATIVNIPCHETINTHKGSAFGRPSNQYHSQRQPSCMLRWVTAFPSVWSFSTWTGWKSYGSETWIIMFYCNGVFMKGTRTFCAQMQDVTYSRIACWWTPNKMQITLLLPCFELTIKHHP